MKKRSKPLKRAEAIIISAIEYAEFHFADAINDEQVIAHRTVLVEKYAAILSELASALKMVST